VQGVYNLFFNSIGNTFMNTWLQDLKINQSVLYIEKSTQRKKLVTVKFITDGCVGLSNGDSVDPKEGENGYRSHYIKPLQITRR
jgi:hypothetical protein